MFLNLLTSAVESGLDSSSATTNGGCNGLSWLIILGIMVVYFIFSNHRYKKKQAEAEKAEAEKRASIRPGTKVVTIGYVRGVVAKVNEDNTVVLETGDDVNKSYVTFDIRAIAEIEKPEDKTEEIAEETTTEPVTESAEETMQNAEENK